MKFDLENLPRFLRKPATDPAVMDLMEGKPDQIDQLAHAADDEEQLNRES